MLISDFSLRLDSGIKHYEWDLDEITFSPEEHLISARWLDILGDENMGRSMLNSIHQDIAIEQRLSTWKYLSTLLGILSFVLLAVAGTYVSFTSYVLTLKSCIVNVLMCTLTELILQLMQLLPTAPNPIQQPLLEPIP
jgi:hypothetical protein